MAGDIMTLTVAKLSYLSVFEFLFGLKISSTIEACIFR